MIELPKWHDWVIDLRLRQFRKVVSDENNLNHQLKMVDFDSVEGKTIFKEYCQDQYNHNIEIAEGYQRIIFDIEDGTFSEDDTNIMVEEMVKAV